MGPGRTLYVEIQSTDNEDEYPIGHTCGESVDMPSYESQEIMERQMRIAMLTCGEIDDDGDYYGSDYGSEDNIPDNYS